MNLMCVFAYEPNDYSHCCHHTGLAGPGLRKKLRKKKISPVVFVKEMINRQRNKETNKQQDELEKEWRRLVKNT